MDLLSFAQQVFGWFFVGLSLLEVGISSQRRSHNGCAPQKTNRLIF